MIITNGQILLLVIIVSVWLIKKLIYRHNSFTRNQLWNIRNRAEANCKKACHLTKGFWEAKEYFENLSWQQWEKEDMELLLGFIEVCRQQVRITQRIGTEWNALGNYVQTGLYSIGNHKLAHPNINIRKKFRQNYKQSVKSAGILRAMKLAEKEIRYRYGYLYLLPQGGRK